jgi:cytochrome c peroxidase
VFALGALTLIAPQVIVGAHRDPLDQKLTQRLHEVGFTGRVESTLPKRLGRPVNTKLADTGRLLFFDTITSLTGDNSCAGCHSPATGFGDTQSIAIGIWNNGVVGPGRSGPRNERRAPMVLNTAFFPALMWNGRFSSLSGNPFDNSKGFLFPDPEGTSLSSEPQLLVAQAFTPIVERIEEAGDNTPGTHDEMRAEVVRRIAAVPEYAQRLGAPVTYDAVAKALAEFEFSLTFANAPVDRYARGDLSAMTASEKRGALLFFGPAGCGSCHSVGGKSNEMFSDFKEHVLGVPQLVPDVTESNGPFDGPAKNQDYGRETFTGNASDRYAFRTPSLRNVALEPEFMHDGAFTSLAAAIRFHLDVAAQARSYDPKAQGVAPDLRGPLGPIEPILSRLDPLVSNPIKLTDPQFNDLLAFVRDGLLDPRARPKNLRRLVPAELPSKRSTLIFQF